MSETACETIRVLVLDDDEERHAAFAARLRAEHVVAVHVRNVKGALESIKGPRFDAMFLDHDLGDYGPEEAYGYKYEFTGKDVAHALARLDADKHPGQVVIHSWNPDGAKEMLRVLRAAGIAAVAAPFEFMPGERAVTE